MEGHFETAVGDYLEHDPSLSINDVTVSSSSEDIVIDIENEEKIQDCDSLKTFLWQTIPPFMLAGVGMVGAGALFDSASNQEFMRAGALNLVPALLGLNGNLQMTLASRISTMANLGFIDKKKQQLWALVCNVGLIQVQAIIVSLIAAIVVIVLQNMFNLSLAVWLMASATLTLSIGSILLASIMVLLTVVAKKFNINPDNIATPLAGTTGDVTTIYLFIKIASYFYENREIHLTVHCLILAILLFSTIGWIWIASRQKVTLQVLKYGWGAILSAMCFSSGSGAILDKSTSQFDNLAKFQTVINGVGGNLVAIHSSKISTYLHKFADKGELPANTLLTYFNPIKTFNCKTSIFSMVCLLTGFSWPCTWAPLWFK
uniref:SLC41A/MgtE integral membrane domain-containing protein n=1 Tax=Ditylenchus dipsaci TaxID=166011 RepID=A0A915DHW8_9BILA